MCSLAQDYVKLCLRRLRTRSLTADALNRLLYFTGRRLHNSKQSPSRFHAKVSALVGGKAATSFFIFILCVFGLFVSRARDACYNYLSCSLLNNSLSSCAVSDLLMCNVGPHDSMQEGIKIVVHREL